MEDLGGLLGKEKWEEGLAIWWTEKSKTVSKNQLSDSLCLSGLYPNSWLPSIYDSGK